MKVLFLFGGMPHYYNYILNRLNDTILPNGEEVSITVISPIDQGKTIGAGVFQTNTGIEFKHIQLTECGRLEKNNLHYKKFISILIKEKPDIIVTIYPYLRYMRKSYLLRFILKYLGIKVVLKDHPFHLLEYDRAISKIQQMPIPMKVSAIIGMIENKLHMKMPVTIVNAINIFIRRFRISRYNEKKRDYLWMDAVVCYVDDAYAIFGSYGVSPEKIFITRNSPDTDMIFRIKEDIEKKTPISKKPYRIVHVGRLVEWKRVDLLLEALKIVKLDFPEAEAIVIGDGPMGEKWKEYASTLGLTESVNFAGPIHDYEKLGKELMSSSVYVLAGMGGLSLNDAMSFGLPVICSVCDGTEKKLVRDGYNGYYFKEGDSMDLAEKIKLAFTNLGCCREMGNNSINIIREQVNIHTVIDGYIRSFLWVNRVSD